MHADIDCAMLQMPQSALKWSRTLSWLPLLLRAQPARLSAHQQPRTLRLRHRCRPTSLPRLLLPVCTSCLLHTTLQRALHRRLLKRKVNSLQLADNNETSSMAAKSRLHPVTGMLHPMMDFNPTISDWSAFQLIRSLIKQQLDTLFVAGDKSVSGSASLQASLSSGAASTLASQAGKQKEFDCP